MSGKFKQIKIGPKYRAVYVKIYLRFIVVWDIKSS